jgi:hypothetical protein
MSLRPVKAIDLKGVPAVLPQGLRPRLEWVAPTALLVDETYQRGLSKESYGLIRKLALGFAWNRMKPPVVVDAGGGASHYRWPAYGDRRGVDRTRGDPCVRR